MLVSALQRGDRRHALNKTKEDDYIMKRNTYNIIDPQGETIGSKFAWNTALGLLKREIKNILKEGEIAELVSSDVQKCEHGLNHVSGQFTWQMPGGKTVTYSIERE
mgnify:CR=1 FL=1